MNIEEYRKKIVEDEKQGEINGYLVSEKVKAKKAGESIKIDVLSCYNVNSGLPCYTEYTWYIDDSLNDDVRDSIIRTFGTEGYEKFIEEISKTQKGESLIIDLSSFWTYGEY